MKTHATLVTPNDEGTWEEVIGRHEFTPVITGDSNDGAKRLTLLAAVTDIETETFRTLPLYIADHTISTEHEGAFCWLDKAQIYVPWIVSRFDDHDSQTDIHPMVQVCSIVALQRAHVTNNNISFESMNVIPNLRHSFSTPQVFGRYDGNPWAVSRMSGYIGGLILLKGTKLVRYLADTQRG